ncbi:spirocyclase AveC family protein [Nocardia sp. NPDC059246]|uniref:spirocyclase AveC family protein n=1 Tax=unclassified Nocardia TaxID=2637762 RepID=UPI00368A42EC
MKETMSSPVDRPSISPRNDDPRPRQIVPVKAWATVGALILAAVGFVFIRWMTSPYFTTTPSGPSDPPAWMKICLVAMQIILPLGELGLICWFVVRPWLQDRRIGADGILVIAFATLFFWDPISSYAGHWFTYNSWLFNKGSWLHSVPGSLAFGKPGQEQAYPLLVIPGAYVCIFMLTVALGGWVMRTARSRMPRIGTFGLLVITYPVMVLFDVVFEGIVFEPMGAWSYPGAHLALFEGTYHAFPLSEALTTGLLFTGWAALRYFTNDHGQMVSERGIEEIGGSQVKKTLLRALATAGIAHVIFFCTYNLPNTWMGLHSSEWPKDVQERSYLTDHLCGASVNRACPGPGIPIPRNDNSNRDGGSAYLDANGNLVVPPGTHVGPSFPYQR